MKFAEKYRMTRSDKIFLLIGALSLMTTAMLSAYGFHGLTDKAAQESWGWAVQMQVYHSLGLILITLINLGVGPSMLRNWSRWIFVFGMLVFCGSIYAEQLGAPAAIGAITPIGGISFMLGWALVALSIWLTPARD